MMASSAYHLGESVLRCNPFVAALKTTWKSLRCDHCFYESDKLIKCPNCDEFWYCSDECLNSDSRYHQVECGSNFASFVNKRCSEPNISEETDWMKFQMSVDEYVTHTQLILRIIIILMKDPSVAAKKLTLADGNQVCYNDIDVSQCQRMTKVWKSEDEFDFVDEVMYNFGAWLLVVKEVLQLREIYDKIGSVAEDLLMRAFRIVVQYTVYVNDTSFINVLGKAIYIELCFISHNCIPNCAPFFNHRNILDLRVIKDNVFGFSQLRYDYQIEMSGCPASELKNMLSMRNINCCCKRCSNPGAYRDDPYQRLTKTSMRYGNRTAYDYAKSMQIPITDIIERYSTAYGEYHPWLTALLLWKLRIEIELIFFTQHHDISFREVYQTLKKVHKALIVTHGENHEWTQQIKSIESRWNRFENFQQTDSTEMMDVNDSIDDDASRVHSIKPIDNIRKIIEATLPLNKLQSKLS